MKVKDLIEQLKQYPEDMEVWVSDGGYSEGGVRLTKIEKKPAHEAGLDGDDVDDEYLYIDDNNINIPEYLAKGYLLSKDGDVLYKEILYLNDF